MTDSRNNKLLSYIVLLAVVAFIFCAPLAVRRPFEKEPFDRNPIVKIRKMRPQYIFIGNSLLNTRIDTDLMNRELGKGSVLSLGVNRTYSAHWFLQLKNYVVHSGHKPKTVFIFFNHTSLTDPGKNAGDEIRKSIEKVSHSEEKALEKVLYGDVGMTERLAIIIGELYSIKVYRESIERDIRFLSYAPVSPKKLVHNVHRVFPGLFKHEIPQNEIDDASIEWKRFSWKVDGIFSLTDANLRKVEDEQLAAHEQAETLDFDARVNSSFLPRMLGLCDKHGINLVFVRVKRRPAANGRSGDSWKMKQYMRNLELYIERKGFVFYDFSSDPMITRDMYLDSWHIDPKSKQKYTRIFMDRMADILK